MSAAAKNGWKISAGPRAALKSSCPVCGQDVSSHASRHESAALALRKAVSSHIRVRHPRVGTRDRSLHADVALTNAVVLG